MSAAQRYCQFEGITTSTPRRSGNVPRLDEFDLLRQRVSMFVRDSQAQALSVGQKIEEVRRSRNLYVTNRELVELMLAVDALIHFANDAPGVMRRAVQDHEHKQRTQVVMK